MAKKHDDDDDQLPLFDEARKLTRRTDPHTSYEAGASILPIRTKLQEKVFRAFERYGPMSDDKLVAVPELAAYGPSTIRTRRSELHQAGVVFAVGMRRNAGGRQTFIWHIQPMRVAYSE